MNGHQSQGRGPDRRPNAGGPDRRPRHGQPGPSNRPVGYAAASACSGPARPLTPGRLAYCRAWMPDPARRGRPVDPRGDAIGLRDAGFEVDAAADGGEGLDRFRAEPYRPRPARRDAAAPRRPRGLPRRSGETSTVPDGHAHRARRHDGRRRRARGRRRRLRPKPFELPELDRPGPGRDPPGRPRGRTTPTRSASAPLAIDVAGRTATPRRPRDPAHPDRVRPPRSSSPGNAGQVLTPRRPARPGLGLRLPRRFAARRRRDPAAAGEGRGGSRRAGADPDRARRRATRRLAEAVAFPSERPRHG